MDWTFAALLVFLLAVFALRGWLKLQAGRGPGLAMADQAALDRALDQARRLEERIDSLERILDDDMPGWRRRAGA